MLGARGANMAFSIKADGDVEGEQGKGGRHRMTTRMTTRAQSKKRAALGDLAGNKKRPSKRGKMEKKRRSGLQASSSSSSSSSGTGSIAQPMQVESKPRRATRSKQRKGKGKGKGKGKASAAPEVIEILSDADDLMCTEELGVSTPTKPTAPVNVIKPNASPKWRNIDMLDQENPEMVTTYVNDIYNWYFSAEETYMPLTTYVRTVQTDISAQMRGILMDWLVEVAEEYRLLPQTLSLCANLIDRCLSKVRNSRSKLQLLGCACMLVAAKYEEIYAPAVDEFVYISDNTYNSEEVLEMERTVLNTLGFELTVPTTQRFLTRFLKAAEAGDREQHMSSYLLELSMIKYEFLRFRPSTIAASCLFLARHTLDSGGRGSWNATLSHYTRYRVEQGQSCPIDLQPCVALLHSTHKKAKKDSLQAVVVKYKEERFSAASTVRPAESLPF